MKVKSILISQPAPASEKSPYYDLVDRYKLNIDFCPFIELEAVEGQEFRQERIDIREHTAIILTSRNSIDHFFRMCKEMRVKVPDTQKYFCISESVAYYLHKYIQYRKRKVFIGKQSFKDLLDVIKKHKNEKYLMPCSDITKPGITEGLDKLKIDYNKAVFYRTIASDLSAFRDLKYDMLVFFSPSGIESLLKNFPDFEQGNTRIAAFGPTTHKAVKDAGLKLDISAPTPQTPSMSMAIEAYVKQNNKR